MPANPFAEVDRILAGGGGLQVENCTGANCGDALANYLNSGPLKDTGQSLPRGGIGPGDLASVGKARGSAVYSKENLSPDALTPGTVIHMTRQPGDRNYEYGKTHIGIVDVDETGNRVFKSFTAGKGWRTDKITPQFIAQLPAKITATNPVNPDLNPSKAEQFYQALKNPGQRKTPQQFAPYQIAAAGEQIPAPPSNPFDEVDKLISGKSLAEVDALIEGKQPQSPTAPGGWLAPKENAAPVQEGPPEPLTPWKTLRKTILRLPDWDAAKRNIDRWLVQEKGVENFNKDVTAAFQTPEAMAFGGLDPMVGITTFAGKAPGLLKTAKPVIDRQLQTLGRVVGGEGAKYNPRLIEDLRKTALDFGIELTVPELTNSPTLRGLWVRLAKTPGPQAEKIANYLEEIRNPQVSSAIQKELSLISPANLDKFQAGSQGVAAAGKIEEGLKAKRAAETRPIYREAFKNAQPVDIDPVYQQLAAVAEKYPEGHPSLDALQKVSKMLTREQLNPATGALEIVPETNLEVLHNVNTGIGQLLEKAKLDRSIDNDTRRLLTGLKEKLKGQMEATNPLYNRAQGTYRLLSKPINDFRWGNPEIQPRDPRTKTVIAQIADLGDEAGAKAPGIIFNSDPAQISRTRKWFEENYPGTWDGLVKAHLEDRLHRIKDTVTERETNIGGVFKRTVFNDEQAKAKFKAALTPEKYERLEKFMGVLDKTRRIIYTNSETAYQIKAGDILEKGGITEFMQGVPTSKYGVFKWAAGVFDKVKNPIFASELADALLNPANAAKIHKLNRQIPSKNNALETAVFLENIFQKTGGFQGPPSIKE